jgi:hypothetical protein
MHICSPDMKLYTSFGFVDTNCNSAYISNVTYGLGCAKSATSSELQWCSASEYCSDPPHDYVLVRNPILGLI